MQCSRRFGSNMFGSEKHVDKERWEDEWVGEVGRVAHIRIWCHAASPPPPRGGCQLVLGLLIQYEDRVGRTGPLCYVLGHIGR